MVSHFSVDSPFCNTSAALLVRQSKSPEDREIGRRFAPLWEVLVPKLHEVSPGKDAKGNFVFPSLDVRAQVLSIYDGRSGIGKPVFSLAPCGHEQKFNVIAPGLCAPHVCDVVLQQIVNDASTPAQNRMAHV